MPFITQNIPKAELHVHLEGTITPKHAKILAKKNGLTLPDDIFQKNSDTAYNLPPCDNAQDALRKFITAYDVIANTLKTAQDYTDITYNYLIQSSLENVIYTELGISADHGAMIGLTYKQMVDAIALGINKAKKETGIEARMISTCVRHIGPESSLKAAEQTISYRHPLVTGFGMAGDENAYNVIDFKPAFDLVKKSGLQVTAHAGEASGAETIKEVRDILGCKRFGHMVRITEDTELFNKMADEKAVPEICISSNISLNVFKSLDKHPVRKIWDAGFPVTLSSDDPPFFGTTIGQEYEKAYKYFGFTLTELLHITENSLNAAFVDDKTRQNLLERLKDFRESL